HGAGGRRSRSLREPAAGVLRRPAARACGATRAGAADGAACRRSPGEGHRGALRGRSGGAGFVLNGAGASRTQAEHKGAPGAAAREHRTTGRRDGGPPGVLFDAGGFAQLRLELLDALALELLADLRRDLGERRRLRVADVVEPDHMEAELRLGRRLGDLALLERDHGVAELLDEGIGRVPVEVTAVRRRARVLRLLGKGGEILAGLQL